MGYAGRIRKSYLRRKCLRCFHVTYTLWWSSTDDHGTHQIRSSEMASSPRWQFYRISTKYEQKKKKKKKKEETKLWRHCLPFHYLEEQDLLVYKHETPPFSISQPSSTDAPWMSLLFSGCCTSCCSIPVIAGVMVKSSCWRTSSDECLVLQG